MKIQSLLFLPLLLYCSCSTLTAETATFEIGSRAYTLQVEEEHEGGYDCVDWNHWIRVENSRFEVRDKVLQEESLIPVTITEGAGGRDRVTEDLWLCPFTGETLTTWRQVDINHIVPLKEAHDSGGYAWDSDRREAYANHLEYEDHLMAVKASANRSKGAQDPAEWIEVREDFIIDYLEAWLFIKTEWDLSVDEIEADSIHRLVTEMNQ